MQLFFVITLFIVFLTVVVISIIRKLLKGKSKELSEQIRELPSYDYKVYYEKEKDRLSILNNRVFVDIPTEIKSAFCNNIISSMQEKDFVNHYTSLFQDACSLLKKLEIFNINPSESIYKFVNDYKLIDKLVKQHNEDVITSLLDAHKEFFDNCLEYPLDRQQRRSIVSEAENCLVVSSAGSGKTSSIVGKVKYLIEKKGIAPNRILLISYTNKAASELTERMATDGLRGSTFHKLAIDIIGKETGIKPSICDNTDALFVDIYHTLLDDENFKKSVLEYFVDYQVNETDWEQRKNERREKLSEQKSVKLKTMFPDMDGKSYMLEVNKRKRYVLF